MSSVNPFATCILIVIQIFAGLLFLLGLSLLISGFRRRRIGDEPHCRKCNYILLYLQSLRCPECGTEISAQNTVIGEYRRRWGRTVTGLILMILACMPVVPSAWRAIETINWYHYKTASWVFADLDTSGMFAQAIADFDFGVVTLTLQLVITALNDILFTTKN